MVDANSDARRDFVNDRLVSFLLWKLPGIAMLLALLLDVGDVARTVVWVPALSVLGGGCVANALRCGRLHCYITGPFFLLMAGAALLHGLGVQSFGPRGWLSIGAVTLVGGVILTYLPERMWGKYARNHATNGGT